MKHVLAAAVFAVSLTPAVAEESEMGEGLSLMEEGARLLFRGLVSEMEPALEGLEGLADEMRPALEMLMTEMGPALMELAALIDEVGNYEAPEVLPNGDIIIRRKPDAPVFEPPVPDAPERLPEEIEL